MKIIARQRAALAGVALAALANASVVKASTHAEQQATAEADHHSSAIVIERQAPDNPRHRPRKTQEAWVQMSYVVTADGRAIDPIITNSSGGSSYEREVREVTGRWRFEPTDNQRELPYNIVDARFTVLGRGKGTTRKFARYAQHIMKNLHAEKPAAARGVADEALRIGGWSLYESTILWLMVGRIEGAEGDDVEKLEMYRRGLAVSDDLSLRSNARVDLLEEIFELESQFGQFAAAIRTFTALKAVRGSADAVQRLSARADEIMVLIERDPEIVAQATIMNPCDCEEGQPLWDYSPVRRTFSFANIVGNVQRFEARCEQQRISDDVRPDQTWTLGKDSGFCRILVFGDDNATFDFLEHLPDNDDNSAANTTTVARNHVLDRRSRSQ
ncbi:MAG: energy transducer TonB [Woeseiaceae bacterium]|nr:energy transducer TonB [Woeseiaceae bacterium]